MKIVTIVGARPQFIKAASVSRAIQKHNEEHDAQITEVMVHGYNVIAGCSSEGICGAFGDMVERSVCSELELYGGGRASERIVRILNSTDN